MPTGTRQFVGYSGRFDASRRYLTDAPTYTRMAGHMKSVDDGDVAALLEINEEMEAKDAHLRSVAQTRRGALVGLPWRIEPNGRAMDSSGAEKAATFIEESLSAIETWDTTLEHLSSALGPNVAVTELIWVDALLVRTNDVAGHRLSSEPWYSRGIRVLTELAPVYGIATLPGKFVVYHPDTRAGFPLRSTIVHACIVPYMFRNLNGKDWAAFNELYGTPWRWAEYTSDVIDEDRTKVIDFLKNTGPDAAASIPAGITIKTQATLGTGETYEKLMAWAERAMSKAYLGQTLTTDIGDVGSRAAATVHNNVRTDLLAMDIRAEARTIEQQIFRHMLRLKFPGESLPCPRFIREIPERRDVESERLTLDQMAFALGNGMRLDEETMYHKLALPAPTTPQPKKSTNKEAAATINELTLGIERAVRSGDVQLVNALRRKISELLGEPLADLASLPRPEPVDAGRGATLPENEKVAA